MRPVARAATGAIPAAWGPGRQTLALQPEAGVYPRGCGGPSPGRSIDRVTWAIPAGAGESPASPFSVTRRGGLSPRVRGNAPESGRRRSEFRCHVSMARFNEGAGANARKACRMRFKLTTWGLSPRVRGNAPESAVVDLVRPPARSYASMRCGRERPGKLAGSGETSEEVYPRGCGGTPRKGGASEGKLRELQSPPGRERPGKVTPLQAAQGLSPRVRGNAPGTVEFFGDRPARAGGMRPLLRTPLERDLTGSIPAGAGEPTAPESAQVNVPLWSIPADAVGTNEVGALERPRMTGLSPRVRGNR